MKKENRITKPIKVYTCTTKLEFKMTSSEAYEVLKNPKGKVAKNLRRYMTEFLQQMAKSTLTYEKQIKAEEELKDADDV